MTKNIKLNKEIKKNDTIRSSEKNIKTYNKPFLKVLGDLRTLTLGASPGIDDASGDVNNTCRPGGTCF